jgi:hypothetical protein
MGFHGYCAVCEKRFTAARRTRRFCSDDCRQRAHRALLNDPTRGRLSELLREVADALDAGQGQRAQLARLRRMLERYEWVLYEQALSRLGERSSKVT